MHLTLWMIEMRNEDCKKLRNYLSGIRINFHIIILMFPLIAGPQVAPNRNHERSGETAGLLYALRCSLHAEGILWHLGHHRILCQVGGEVPGALCFHRGTGPPEGAAYGGVPEPQKALLRPVVPHSQVGWAAELGQGERAREMGMGDLALKRVLVL